ncbi:MAG: universal stress protein [Acidobacteriia bacterium]|nr:universal stress protein [Terriglobia bacterium]
MYLGYAAGVGKTYQMMEDAQDLHRKGVDVVIGYFEPHGRKDTIAKTDGLENIPRRIVDYRGARLEEMDAAAILRRRPAVAVVDEFAHTNVPGSDRLKRWEDVRMLLDAGIDVLTTMNVQHLESLNDQVWNVTGVRVRETVPDWVVDEADEVRFIDLTPRALRNRLERGVIYGTEKAHQAMEHFFTETNLAALREIALRHAAHEVEEKLDDAPVEALPQGRPERILICVTGNPSSASLIRRGKRLADYLRAECIALHVLPHGGWDEETASTREAVERHMHFARNLRIDTHSIPDGDPSAAIANFARAQRITQIFMGRSLPRPWFQRFGETVVQRVVRLSPDTQITIVAERRR